MKVSIITKINKLPSPPIMTPGMQWTHTHARLICWFFYFFVNLICMIYNRFWVVCFSFNCFANILWHWDRLCYCQRKVCTLCTRFSMTHSSLTLTFYILHVYQFSVSLQSIFKCNWKLLVLIHVLNCTIPKLITHKRIECTHCTINEFSQLCRQNHLNHSLACIALQIKSIMHNYILWMDKPKTHPNAIESGAKSSHNYTIAARFFLSTKSVFSFQISSGAVNVNRFHRL